MKIITRSQRSKLGARPGNILCLSVDRLNADVFGAYGATWLDTPAFDTLAAESILFDSFYATSLDLDALLRAFWRGESPAQFLGSEEPDDAESLFRVMKRRGYRTFLLSDDERVALSPNVDSDDCDERFLLDGADHDAAEPVDSIDQTAFFKNFEELARFLVRINETRGLDEPQTWFVWAHFSGWNTLWDFPFEWRELFRHVVRDPQTGDVAPEESDPQSYAATTPPYFPRAPKSRRASRARNAADDVRAACARTRRENDDELDSLEEQERARIAALDESDRRQSVLQAYCGGVSVFDKTLEGFLTLLKDRNILKNTLFALTGTRGLALGAPGAIGRPGADDVPSPFYAEEIRVPLLLRLPDGTGATIRLPQLCEPRDLFATLREWFEFAPNLASDEFWRLEKREISPLAGRWGADHPAAESPADQNPTRDDAPFPALDPDKPGQNLLALLADEERALRDSIRVVAKDSSSTERALVVDEWLLKTRALSPEERDGDPNASDDLELYALPDDRFCVNDVADRCAEIAEKLKTALDTPPKA